MPYAVGYQLKFLMDSTATTLVDLSQYVVGVSGWDASVDMEDTTTAGNGSKSFTPTLKDGDVVTLDCIWEPTLHAHMIGCRNGQAPGTTWTAKYGPAGSATGLPFEQAEFYVQKVSPPAQVGSTVKCQVTLQMTGACTFGTW